MLLYKTWNEEIKCAAVTKLADLPLKGLQGQQRYEHTCLFCYPIKCTIPTFNSCNTELMLCVLCQVGSCQIARRCIILIHIHIATRRA
jgi:hypothetical protein